MTNNYPQNNQKNASTTSAVHTNTSAITKATTTQVKSEQSATMTTTAPVSKPTTAPTEPHWAYTLAQYCLERFAHSHDATLNEQVARLIRKLGEALDDGDTVLVLTDKQTSYLQNNPHPLVALVEKAYEDTENSANKPIVIHGQHAYMHRQWLQESGLANSLQAMLMNKESNEEDVGGLQENTESQHDLSHLPSTMKPEQRQAVETALNQRFCLITGGPGTGKTWTVAQLVITLLKNNPEYKIALAAPTGKAAQRMQEALENGIKSSLSEDEKEDFIALVKSQLEQAKTVHKLLSIGHSAKPRFHQNNPLGYDLLIVDEASMLGVALANQLLNAISNKTKLILLGDANQLAAVDAGAVLADLCASTSIKPVHVNITQSTRFDDTSGIGKLASATLDSNCEDAHKVIQSFDDLTQYQPQDLAKQGKLYTQLWQNYEKFAESLQVLYAQSLPDVQKHIHDLFTTFDTYRILSATHEGMLGARTVNQHMSSMLQKHLGISAQANKHNWFHGRAVMMQKNDPQLGLANGDIGIVLYVVNQGKSEHMVFFPTLQHALSTSRFSEDMLSTAFAMTIHKSQGSEYNTVAVLLAKPQEDARTMLCKELIYTGITRAKHNVHLYADNETIDFSITTQAVRKTGLQSLLG